MSVDFRWLDDELYDGLTAPIGRNPKELYFALLPLNIQKGVKWASEAMDLDKGIWEAVRKLTETFDELEHRIFNETQQQKKV